MDKPLRDIFVGARELLSDPARWGKGSFWDPNADCFCLIGACGVAAGLDAKSFSRMEDGFEELIAEVTPPLLRCIPADGFVSQFNDSPRTTHADILAVLDCAIKCCDEKGA